MHVGARGSDAQGCSTPARSTASTCRYDDGDHWQALSRTLPDTPVSDIWVEGNDVAIATHGRGFYILDDVAPLRQYGATVTTDERVSVQAGRRDPLGAGGATISYWLKTQPQKMTLEILDSKGQVVRTFEGALPNAGRGGRGGRGGAPARTRRRRGDADDERSPRRMPRRQAAAATSCRPTMKKAAGAAVRRRRTIAAGLNHFTWDLQYAAGASRSPAWCCGARRPTVRSRCPAPIRCG